MTEMALIVPTRGRPDNIVRLYNALSDTNADVELVIGIDQDDPRINDYYDVVANRNISMVVSPDRRRFGPTLDAIARRYAEEYEFLAWCGDDHLPKTYEWDRHYREELSNMKAGIVYGNDLIMGEKIPTQMGFTSNIVKALGYAVPTGFIHLYIDNYFLELGKAIGGVKYLPDVIFQHLHPCAGGAAEDLTYREANSPEHWSNDFKRFKMYMAHELEDAAEKIRKYCS